MNSQVQPFAVGRRISLRDRTPADLERVIYWQTHGEWLQYDAPWEQSGDSLTPEQEEKFRTFFEENISQSLPSPRTNAMIVFSQMDCIVGWVNRYMDKRFPKVFYTGINICEDEYLNQGLGTEAFSLWIDYLFKESDAHKIECHTWSLNPRMIRVAQKLGFKQEGVERELIHWQDEWHDRLRFGLLRREWQPPQREKISPEFADSASLQQQITALRKLAETSLMSATNEGSLCQIERDGIKVNAVKLAEGRVVSLRNIERKVKKLQAGPVSSHEITKIIMMELETWQNMFKLHNARPAPSPEWISYAQGGREEMNRLIAALFE